MIVTDDHPPMVGGVAVFTERVAIELAQRGHRVCVLARWRRSIAPIPGAALARLPGLGFSRWGGRWAALRGSRALRRADRVLATTWPVATGLAALGVDYDLVAHGSDVTRPPRDPDAFARTWAAAGRRWAMSGFLAERLAERGFDARVLPAPVSVAPAPGPRPPIERPERWLLIARATPLKGGDRFVRWVAAAGVRGAVVGDGPELPSWRALAASLGADIAWLGACSPQRTAAAVAASDLLVLVPRAEPDGSGAEGLGLVAIEAAAMGVAAVGCRTGGVPEAIGPGLLVDAPDDPAAAVSAIRAWWTPDRGPRARAWCLAHHGTDRTVDALGGALVSR